MDELNNAAVVAGMVDLAIAKADDTDPVNLNETITYTLTAQNSGPTVATSVLVTDRLPAAVEFVSAEPDCSNQSGVVACSLGPLVPGAEASATINVTASSSGTMINTATVSSAEVETNPADNTAIEETTVIGMDIEVTGFTNAAQLSQLVVH